MLLTNTLDYIFTFISQCTSKIYPFEFIAHVTNSVKKCVCAIWFLFTSNTMNDEGLGYTSIIDKQPKQIKHQKS